MAGAFRDLREFQQKRFLELPIDDHVYKIADVDADTGLWAQTLWEVGIAAHQGDEVDGSKLDDDDERNAYARLLGDAFDEMFVNGVGWADVKHAALTTLVWIIGDEENAQKFWESGGLPEAEAAAPAKPNRASRRASAAAANTTKRRASTSGTRATPKARPTPGKKSSDSGPS